MQPMAKNPWLHQGRMSQPSLCAVFVLVLAVEEGAGLRTCVIQTAAMGLWLPWDTREEPRDFWRFQQLPVAGEGLRNNLSRQSLGDFTPIL